LKHAGDDVPRGDANESQEDVEETVYTAHVGLDLYILVNEGDGGFFAVPRGVLDDVTKVFAEGFNDPQFP
jgi:hypothetical protein